VPHNFPECVPLSADILIFPQKHQHATKWTMIVSHQWCEYATQPSRMCAVVSRQCHFPSKCQLATKWIVVNSLNRLECLKKTFGNVWCRRHYTRKRAHTVNVHTYRLCAHIVSVHTSWLTVCTHSQTTFTCGRGLFVHTQSMCTHTDWLCAHIVSLHT